MPLATLLGILRRETEALNRTVALCLARLGKRHEFAQNGHEDILADSLAACLHSFYTGLENLLETIAAELDELPQGPQWLKRLLDIMTAEIPGIRPTVLSETSRDLLDDFRSFRHRFRNLYTHSLRPELVFALAGSLEETWRRTRADLETFLAAMEGQDGRKS